MCATNVVSFEHIMLHRQDPRTAFTIKHHPRRQQQHHQQQQQHLPTVQSALEAATCSQCNDSKNANIMSSSRPTSNSSSNSCCNRSQNVLRRQCSATASATSSSAAPICNATFCKVYKSPKTKSYGFLLIFLCAIVLHKTSAVPVISSGQRLILHTPQYRQLHHQHLLREQRSLAAPTPPHHRHHMHLRSASMPEPQDMNSICQQIKELQFMKKQTNSSYINIRDILNGYTDAQFNTKRPENVHTEWEKHMLQLIHPLTPHLERNFDKTPDMSHVEHGSITSAMLAEEMQKVYTALLVLKDAFKTVLEMRNDPETANKLLHELHGDRAKLDRINAFLKQAEAELKMILSLSREAMEKLQIEVQEQRGDENPINFHENHAVRDWLLASENLSVMQYIRTLLTVLSSKCPPNTA